MTGNENCRCVSGRDCVPGLKVLVWSQNLEEKGKMIFRDKIYAGYVTGVIAVSAAICASASPVDDADDVEGKLIDGLVAQVNESYITVSDVLAQLEPLRNRMARLHNGRELEEELKKAFKQVTEELIARELVLDAYAGQERQLPEVIIDERTEEIIREVFDGDRNELMDELAAARMTYEQWREKVRDEMVISFMKRVRIDSNINVSPLDVEEFYEQNREQFRKERRVNVSMILLQSGEEESLDSRIETVKEVIQGGRSFAEVAREYSDGSKADRGGDWGWVELENLRKELQSAIEELKPGEVSDPVHLGQAAFFVKLKELKGGEQLSLPEVRDEISQRIEGQKRERLYDTWISALKEKAVIKKWNVSLF